MAVAYYCNQISGMHKTLMLEILDPFFSSAHQLKGLVLPDYYDLLIPLEEDMLHRISSTKRSITQWSAKSLDLGRVDRHSSLYYQDLMLRLENLIRVIHKVIL